MKKMLLPLIAAATILVLILVACAAKVGTSTTSGNSPSANGTPQPGGTFSGANLTQPLPLASQLVVGTFKLEGTNNAVTSQEATDLVPLWQAYAQLLGSNTTAQAELDAVLTQIQGSMAPKEVQAITDMKLTRQDEFAAMSSLGLATGRTGANGTPGFSGTRRAAGGGGGNGFGGGGFPSGGGPVIVGGGPDIGSGGGFGGTGGGGFNPTQLATFQAAQAQFSQFANYRVSTPLLNALISLLQKRGGS